MTGEQTQLEHSSTDRKLDPELKAKWLDALRSGKYKQGQAVLRTSEECFCCLGVLGDIAAPTLWATTITSENEAHISCYAFASLHDNEMLREEWLADHGLTIDQAVNLASMNDCGKSFAEIADFIEANL
jgi:hypothetical protein